MCDCGPQQPPAVEQCGFESENLTAQLETDASSPDQSPILAPVAKLERKSTLGSIGPVDDDEEDIRLSCDDRTDSGIDVSYLERPLSRFCEKHGCISLLQLSTNGSCHRENIDHSAPVVKHPLSNELVEDWISALLLSVEKVHLSWQVPGGQRPHRASASCTKLPENPARDIAWQPQNQSNVNIGSSDKAGRADGSHRNQSARDHAVFRGPPDDDASREHEIDVDPNQPASDEDFTGGYPCIFHNVGSVDPTPRCAWRRQYTSQLRGHHFHSNHPNGPFGCCSRCFETGRLIRTQGETVQEWRRFANRAEVAEHEKKCTRDICIEETCHNYDQVPPALSPCSHGAKQSQPQIWRMWYRRAHRLSRNEGVPDLAASSSQHLRPLSTVIERSQSSPGYAGTDLIYTRTPGPRTIANATSLSSDSPAVYQPTASGSSNPANSTAHSTREELTRLAKGLIERMQVDPSELGMALRRTCEQILNSSERVQYNLLAISQEDAEAIELLRNLVQECLRLLTTPMERTPTAWFDLSLSALLTLHIEIPTQPPANWCHERQHLPQSSTSSSFDGAVTMAHPRTKPDAQQQQQQQLLSHAHQYSLQHPASDIMAMMRDPQMNAPPLAITFSSPASVAQMGGAFTSQAADFSSIGVEDHIAQHIVNVPDQPYYPHQRLRAMNQPSTSMHGLALQGQPPSMDPNNFPLSIENAYLRSRQGLLPMRLIPSESDGDSGVFSTAQSNDYSMGGTGNDKGKSRANEASEEPMDYSYRCT